MNYKNLKASYKAKNDLYKHYKDLFETSLIELKFEKLQADYLMNILDEVLELNNKKVNPKLIKQVIENAKERHYLDKLIHADLIFNN
jgi:hypothetical protein